MYAINFNTFVKYTDIDIIIIYFHVLTYFIVV